MNSYFKGYYYKHQKGTNTVSFIFGKSADGEFIQIITNKDSYNVPYIGNNIFSKEGLKVNINYEGLDVYGNIVYNNLTPIKYDIMGPFKYLPMECRHEIVSMRHDIDGSIIINGETLDFSGGVGYIEGDSGRSFPKDYVWVQCNDFSKRCSIMASIARIPFCGMNFRGCISVVNYEGKEYRFATYLGVKIIEYSNKRIVLNQGKYSLEIDILNSRGSKLNAPEAGKMSRIIYESVDCSARFKFYIKECLVFNFLSENTCFEYVE